MENNNNNNKIRYKTSNAQCKCSSPVDWCPASPQTEAVPWPTPKVPLLSTMSYGMGYPVEQSGSAILVIFPPGSQLPLAEQYEKQKFLPLCENGSPASKVSVYYQHYCHPISTTEDHTSYQEENYLRQNQNNILKTKNGHSQKEALFR